MQKGNGVKGKYMENMDYTIKNIDKLEDLKDFEWEYKNKKFLLLDAVAFDDMLTLVEKNYIDADGYMSEKRYRSFSLKNLTELEFFGLKVVLNEKPKLSKEDKEFLEKEMYFARERNGTLYVYFEKPVQVLEDGQWEANTFNTFDCFPIDEEKFPFITWKSGKAWSKAELMELEVIE
ncbi:Uncharacterised protein [Sebaldella termitidis]|uniref:Uncharacterized protein n=1 Tax=Sebaldella termitidis (strain ATCC 33386 / NCTC 11300) TaxID=526218 RepID=D1AHP5_SEBTE|nr:hypothetical protein [Sebaldella termitidis]ACZ08279.1 hypothetical protein Sterm_1417 [Sebaldella termitidis ATCC 33386]SUI23589.1 Uncharacterised protein [Sebaldella termitidis]